MVEMWERDGVMPAPLAEEPDIPAAAEHVWKIYWDIQSQRGSSGHVGNPISSTQLKAYCELLQIELRPWEARAIFAMDRDAYNVFSLERMKEDAGGKNKTMIPATKKNLLETFRSIKSGDQSRKKDKRHGR